MTTLKDYKKQYNLTNADVGRALGCSANVAGHILQGRHILIISDTQLDALAVVLGITFERCWLSMQESHDAWQASYGLPPRTFERPAITMERARIAMQERIPDAHWERITERPRAWAEVEGVLVVPEERGLS